MDEFALIERFFNLPHTDSAILIGVGDDGAILRPDNGRDIVAVVDTLIEDVHFLSSMPAADIGYRLVAVNVSDVAAMGGRPRWMTLALTLDEADASWLGDFAAGITSAADEYSVQLVGGDTTRGSQKVLSLQIIGDVPAATAIGRSGASNGDEIYVSGTVGDAAAGLAIAKRGAAASAAEQYLLQRFLRPTARVALGDALRGVATAAIDVSDGLFADAQKLLQSSGAGGIVEVSQLPLSDALLTSVASEGAVELALVGGDDYELCFTAAVADAPLVESAAKQSGVAVKKIGTVVEEEGLRVSLDGQAYTFEHAGYRHF